MKVLVAYASRHGATAEIAERIATGLRDAGFEADTRHVTHVVDVEPYDAVVVGASAYLFHWLKDATRFVERQQQALAARPVWLFSSGPLGTDLVDDDGRDVLEVTRPREFDELHARLRPRGEQVFFGAWNPAAPPVGFVERVMHRLPAEAMPAGDFRDWDAIDAWTIQIARELRSEQTAPR
ncbi:MAG: flavodoxin domain-containing protein [Actinobacteria bacterium]|jgi:menaquinone-dependent protoporphyrinogen oxidase|nr:flavodoxin domain-containing protein [Actinomycetota bacterium]